MKTDCKSFDFFNKRNQNITRGVLQLRYSQRADAKLSQMEWMEFFGKALCPALQSLMGTKAPLSRIF